MRAPWQTLHLTANIAALPVRAGGNWCALRLHLPTGTSWWASVQLTDPSRGQVVRSVFLGAMRRAAGGTRRETMLHVPPGAAAITLTLWNAEPSGLTLTCKVLGRAETARMLLWRGRRLIAPALLGSHHGWLGRVRAVLGQAPARAGEAPPYDMWIALCEAALPGPPAAPPLDIQGVILAGDDAAQRASLASLAAQTLPAARAPIVISRQEDWSGVSATWIVLLGAGETLAPHALAWFAHAAASAPHAACITADSDRLTAGGARHNPLFLPEADPLLLRTGLPTAGPCALRWRDPPPQLPPDASAARLALALRAPASMVHVPRILAHSPFILARRSFLKKRTKKLLPDADITMRVGWSARGLISAESKSFLVLFFKKELFPTLHLPRDPAFAPSITALVPSQARSAHVARCLRRIAVGTSYPHLRIQLLLSAAYQARPEILRRLRAIPILDIRTTPLQPFNYAAANNAGAAAADGDLLLLLNDDVAPIAPSWLDAMVAHMQDPTVGIVGARLLYGNGMVQHEGVIMGLADLCEHAGRLRAGADPGPHGMGCACRAVSAVTGACMLVRASLYRDLGGMDENFAIALNDVDFCLRAGQAGWRIVYCAEAELHHYESLSLGRHYAGDRAALESLEVRRLRDRWAAVISADPCYNPQASLEPGREWQPAFPPRQG